jgi:acyl CoA:acetate/3-ketoacid CoA transferase
MAIGFRKLSTLCAAVIAIVGLGNGAANAFVPVSQQEKVSQDTPLVLEHGSISSTIVLGEHYSHESHASHVSHYSSRY